MEVGEDEGVVITVEEEKEALLNIQQFAKSLLHTSPHKNS